jgi:PAS domain S-box-containing protein
MQADRSPPPVDGNKSREHLTQELAELRSQLAAKELRCRELSQELTRLQSREITEGERLFRSAVDQFPGVFNIYDAERRLQYVNTRGAEISGLSAEQLIGQRDEELIPPEVCSQYVGDLRKVYATKKRMENALRESEERLRASLGEKDVLLKEIHHRVKNNMQVISSLLSLQADEVQDATLRAVLQDVTHRVRSMAMAHEINNSLMGVVGRVELMKLKAARREVSESDFGDVLGACERIAGLIKRLLAYSRGGHYLSKAIDMTELIHESLAELGKQLNPGIRLSYDFSPGLPKVSGDPMQLQMAVAEIVSNAAEAIGDAGRIEIDLQIRDMDAVQSRPWPGMRPGQYVLLRVRDTGKGMDPETLQQIFEPFFTDKFLGRGLGMAAVYGIVKNHGGWIGVDSEPTMGTTVQLFLPACKASPLPENRPGFNPE